MNGNSTGCIPIQVNIKNVIIKIQNRSKVLCDYIFSSYNIN